MAAWNALFLRRAVWQPDPARTAEWNRGASLVEALGHCSACHSPRNALGAERGGAHLAGGAHYDYLRTGEAVAHGSASGPMATVVDGLSALPDADIRAMATYLASFAGQEGAGQEGAVDEAALARTIEARGLEPSMSGAGARLYAGACASCHEARGLVPLALNSNLYSARPELGSMPAYADSLSDAQAAELAAHLRSRFAPGRPAWARLDRAVATIRGAAR